MGPSTTSRVSETLSVLGQDLFATTPVLSGTYTDGTFMVSQVDESGRLT